MLLSGSGSMTLDYFEFNYDSYVVTNQTEVTINLGLNSNGIAGPQWLNQGVLNYASITDLVMNTNGILDASYAGNTVNYSGGGAQNIKTPVSSYFNLSTSTSGTKTVQNSLTIAGAVSIGASTTLNSNGNNLTIAGNWTDNGSFTEGTRTVTFNGSNNQIITDPSNETFYNLVLNNSGASGNNSLILANNVTSTHRITMTSGNINTGSNILILTPTTAGSLTYSSGIIIGRFQRGVSGGADFLFPVGTSSYYHPAIFNFSSLSSSTNIIAEFINSSPGAFTPYLDDGVNQLDYAFTDGYWNFSSSFAPTNTYTISLDGAGFSSYTIDANSRISGRTSGNSTWRDIGTMVLLQGLLLQGQILSIILMPLLSIIVLQDRCNFIANAGSDVSICSGSSTTLNGSGVVHYSWSPATGLSNPNIANPVASPGVTTTYTLTVTRGVCVSTDQVTVTC